jgi:hypothetical protein
MQKFITAYHCVRCLDTESDTLAPAHICDDCTDTLATELANRMAESYLAPNVLFSAEEKELLLRLLFEDRSTTYGDAAINHNRAILKLQGRPVLF